jgi:hypothetical protein
MFPLTQSAFWGPMAVTVMGGLFIATFMTLLFLPALYAFWFRRRLREEAKAAPAQADGKALAPEPALAPALPHAAE